MSCSQNAANSQKTQITRYSYVLFYGNKYSMGLTTDDLSYYAVFLMLRFTDTFRLLYYVIVLLGVYGARPSLLREIIIYK